MTKWGALTSTKRRVAKPLLKELPTLVAEKVKTLAEDYYIKSATISTVAEGWELYVGEGDRIHIIYGEESTGVEMAASHNIGAAGLCYDIGARTKFPVGTWIIQIHYYNRFWMNIINVVPKRISPPSS